MKALNVLCTLREESERQGASSVISWHTYTHMLDAFSSELGQISNKSPPPIKSCPLQFTPVASKQEGEEEEERSWSWPKKQLLADVLHVSKTQGHTIKYLPKKLYPITTQREGVFGKKRSLKMILKHLWAAVHWRFLPLWSLNGDVERKRNTSFLFHLPSIQLSDYMGQYRVSQCDGC